MSASPAKLVTAMRYRNVAAAIEWLTATFGLAKQHVAIDDDGTIAVAHLSVGTSLIILLPVEGTELDQLMAQPDEIGGAETQNCYLVVEDADLYYAKAKAAGAEFVLDLKQYADGGRGFSCRDPEGHIWSFGTHDPWEGKSPVKAGLPVGEPLQPSNRRRALTMATMAAIAVVMGLAGWMLATVPHTTPNAEEMRPNSELLGGRAREEVGRAARQMGTQLAEARRAKAAAEKALKEARGAREEAERKTRQMGSDLSEARRAKAVAEGALSEAQGAKVRATRQLETQLSEAQHAKVAAEQALKEAQGPREEAERAARQSEAQLAEARRAKATAEKALTAAEGAREEAERTRGQLETQLSEAQHAKAAAEQALKEAKGAREEAERKTGQLEMQLTEARRSKEAAERSARNAQEQLGRAQEEEYGVTEPPRRLAPIGELFSLEDMKRVVALAEEKQLPLPPIRMRKPGAEIPRTLRRFIGIWVSDSGFERTGRQSMIVVTNVLSAGHAVGFYIVGPPRDTRVLPGLPTQADFFAFVGRISGSELLIKKTSPRIVGQLSSRNELNVTEGRLNSPTGRVRLKPVWTLMDAESTTSPK